MNFFNSNFEVDKYCENDVIATLDFLNSIYGISSSHIPEIKKRHLQRPRYDCLLG